MAQQPVPSIFEQSIGSANENVGSSIAMDTKEDEEDQQVDDDEVVQEIDVFLAPELANEMYLLQYPIHQRSVPDPLSAKIKPRHGMLQCDYPVHNELRPRKYSSSTIPVSTHMCLGRILSSNTDDGSSTTMHMVPLSRIQQMRPSFDHLDQQADNMTSDADNDATSSTATTKQPVAVQRKESERAAVIRERSFAFKKQSETAEAWLNLHVVGRDDEDHDPTLHSSTYNETSSLAYHLNRTVCHDLENDVFVEQVVADRELQNNYIQSLNYLTTSVEGKNDSPSDAPESLAKTIVTLLDSGTQIPFSILRQALPKEREVDVLDILSSVALLVRGNWCLCSHYLSMDKKLQRLRTFLLLVLHEHGIVYREPLLAALGYTTSTISSNQVLVLVKTVAKKTDLCWEPKISDNEQFLELHPKVAQHHEEVVWKRIRAQFQEQFQQYNDVVS